MTPSDQLTPGHEWLYDNLKILPETSWAIDPFGLSSTMPYLLAASGVRGGLLIQRVHFAWQRFLGRMGFSEFTWRQSWDEKSSYDMKLRIQHSCTYVITDACGPSTQLCQLFDFNDYPRGVGFKDIRKKAEVLLGQYGRLGSLSKGNRAVVPLGGDFRFSNGSEWIKQYSNYKAIADYINQSGELYHTRIKFTTLKEYFNQVSPPSTTIQGDFFPYSDYNSKCSCKCDPKANYWTGYYTTRPQVKLLSNIVGVKLRAVEILFTLSALNSQREGLASLKSWTEDAQKKLTWARRTWAMFQHHDGITGTSTSRVMRQQTRRLKRANRYLKEMLEELVAKFLNAMSIKPKASSSRQPERLRIFGYYRRYARGKSMSIVIYNSVEAPRNDVLSVTISFKTRLVDVLENDQHLPNQCDQKGQENMVYFRLHLPPLSLKTIQIIEYEGGPVSMRKRQAESNGNLMLANNQIRLHFEEGLLARMIRNDGSQNNMTVRLGTYDLRVGHSGAYLFKPFPTIKYYYPVEQPVLNMGSVLQEIIITYECAIVCIRLLNEDEYPAIYISVDYRLKVDDKELFLEISSDVKSKKWFVDMNDFQLKERKTVDCQGFEANIYPMTCVTYVESVEERLVAISDHSHGVAYPRAGAIQVMLDRRTTADDGKGMGEPLRDNVEVISKFLVLLYKPAVENIDIQRLSRQFNNPLQVLTVRPKEKRYEDNDHEKNRRSKCHKCNMYIRGDWDLKNQVLSNHIEDEDTSQEFLETSQAVSDNRCSSYSVDLLPQYQTYLLLQGEVANGIRIVTLRGRSISAGTPGWALLVLHNTTNSTLCPFTPKTFFTDLELLNIVETTLTGIIETEQYAVLSDIVIAPYTLKSVKLHFKARSKV